MKLWAGRLSGECSELVDSLNSSIGIDRRMYRQDITASMAHAEMLGRCKIIEEGEAEKIVEGLAGILSDLENKSLQIDEQAEDIHTFVEETLTERIGTAGKRLHTARSRNDQVATDFRMYCADETDAICNELKELCSTLCELAKKHLDSVMPGYTHMQRAQPVTLAHCLMAYVWMFLRDWERLCECKSRTLFLPLGSGALAGTTYPIDREFVSRKLSFNGVCPNSIDGVSDRDFAMELANDLAIISVHLSRLGEELVLWSSGEFGFVSLSDDFSTGSSIMPQKKNPDIAELIRGKSARVIGNSNALLCLMKALPSAYNKDMQEDKQALFDSLDTVGLCLRLMTPMLSTAEFKPENMRKAASKGFINATDCADYLTKKGIAFRDAYMAVGKLVSYAVANDKTLETLSMEEYKSFCPDFEADVYETIDLDTCLNGRISYGGPSAVEVAKQIELAQAKLSGEI